MPVVNPMTASMFRYLAESGLTPYRGGIISSLASAIGAIGEAVGERKRALRDFLVFLLQQGEDARLLLSLPEFQKVITNIYPELKTLLKSLPRFDVLAAELGEEKERKQAAGTSVIPEEEFVTPPEMPVYPTVPFPETVVSAEIPPVTYPTGVLEPMVASILGVPRYPVMTVFDVAGEKFPHLRDLLSYYLPYLMIGR